MTNEVKELTCSFSTEASLYLSYMPFIKNGGLFIRGNPAFSLGHAVNLTIKLLNEPDPYTIAGNVVWITPKGAQGGKPPGVGIQFTGSNARSLCNRIETYLAGMIKSTQITDTI